MVKDVKDAVVGSFYALLRVMKSCRESQKVKMMVVVKSESAAFFTAAGKSALVRDSRLCGQELTRAFKRA